MTNIRNALMQAAGSASGDPVYVEDVFSTYLYAGNNTANNAINNGIDLSGEGGMVWIKARNATDYGVIFDTERGTTKFLNSAGDGGHITDANSLTSFNNNGFTLGTGWTIASVNYTYNYASWSFRKQEGFFDVVTYTGNGSGDQTISHNLGSTPGFIAVKATNATSSWRVFHTGTGNTKFGYLNTDSDISTISNLNWNATSTTFVADSSISLNTSGRTYVAYLWASGNDSASQIFGEDGDEAIIKCGSYTGDGTYTQFQDLGFEPQWILFKSADSSDDWWIYDVMRGLVVGGKDTRIDPGDSTAEAVTGSSAMDISATGFTPLAYSTSGTKYIYVAIRRGPMNEPSAGTDVYAGDKADTSVAPMLVSNFPVDLVFPWRRTDITNTNKVATRLLGNNMINADDTSAAYADSDSDFDFQNGYYSWAANNTIYWGNMFRRYPKVFDVVAYSPLLSDPVPRNVHNHNLTVKPELIIVKQTTEVYAARNWAVGAPDLLGVTSSDTLGLNLDVAKGGTGTYNLFDSTQPTATQFTVGYNTTGVGVFGESYIAYLFASLDGISKVGTYTGTGNDLNVTGLGAAARFVLIKRTDSSGDWYVFDTTQGIVSGNDPYVLMNSTSAQVTNTDYIDSHSSGFTITSSAPAALNASGGTYLYLAFA